LSHGVQEVTKVSAVCGQETGHKKIIRVTFRWHKLPLHRTRTV